MCCLFCGGLVAGSSSSPLLVKSMTSEICLLPPNDDPIGLDLLDGAADKESRALGAWVPVPFDVPILVIGVLAFLPPGESSIKSSSSEKSLEATPGRDDMASGLL